MNINAFTNMAREVVNERPDFVYCPDGVGACTYNQRPEDGARCLIGEILFRLGVPEDKLEDVNGDEAARVLLKLGAVPSVIVFGAVLQRFQDDGFTWKQSLEMANRVIGLAPLGPAINMERPSGQQAQNGSGAEAQA